MADPSHHRHHEKIHGHHERLLHRHDGQARDGGEAGPIDIGGGEDAAGMALQHRDEARAPGRVEEARDRRGDQGRAQLRDEQAEEDDQEVQPQVVVKIFFLLRDDGENCRPTNDDGIMSRGDEATDCRGGEVKVPFGIRLECMHGASTRLPLNC
jgi:hypothetical protein